MVIGLAAAAVVAAVAAQEWLLNEGPGPEPDTIAQRPIPRPESMDLNVETEGDFVVFPTRNPDIAVVWLLNGDN